MPVPFTEQIFEYHQTLLNGSNEELLDETFRERLGWLIEAMTNIDSYAKIMVFEDLIRCHPKLDYKQIASTLDR